MNIIVKPALKKEKPGKLLKVSPLPCLVFSGFPLYVCDRSHPLSKGQRIHVGASTSDQT